MENMKFRIHDSNFHVFHMLRRILTAADFSRIRNASLARFTLDRLTKVRVALNGRIRVAFHVAPRWGAGAAATQFPG